MNGLMVLSVATAILLGAYVLMCLVLFTNKSAYQGAERLPLKEDNETINPRHPQQHHERAKP